MRVPSVKVLISSLESVLDQEREDVTIASTIYKEAKEACEVLEMNELTVPRTIEFQVFRNNVEADSASQYYRRS